MSEVEHLLGKLTFGELLAFIVGAVLCLWLVTAVPLCIWCCCRRRCRCCRCCRCCHQPLEISQSTTRTVNASNTYLTPVESSSLDIVVRTPAQEEEESCKTQNAKMEASVTQALEHTLKNRTIIESKRLKLGKLVGQGAFGNVYQGTLTRRGKDSLKVAVKTINASQCSEKEIQQFLDETLSMRGFSHKNVLSVIGLCIMTGKPHVVMPFMDCGDLKTYVKSATRTFTVKELLGYTAQVALGMAYLQEQGFIHRDLAARNCVINSEGVVKVSDFGLARDIHGEEYYRLANLDLPLPVRWMAVESLTSQIFTHKSDVWSFGVMMWEVLTRGKMPYQGLEHVAVIISVRNGTRLQKPDHVTPDIYNIMQKCWKDNPNDRPDFEDLANLLLNMIQHAKLERSNINGTLQK